MTEKLFYSAPKTYEWDSVITAMEEKADGWHVTLKETNFYPEGGGQPSDTGFIGEQEVLDVYKDGDEVYHVLKEKPEKDHVICNIDRQRRIHYTQHHSGQHLLSAVCADLFDAGTVSFHLSDDTATIDLNISSLNDEQIRIIENRVNEYITENRKVNVFYIDRSEAVQYQLRKVPPGIERLRIVEIEGVEYNACGGTHVSSTAEIGLLKILKTERHRGQVRVYFICGLRLLEDYGKKHQVITETANLLTTAPETMAEQIMKIKGEIKAADQKYQALFQEYGHALINQWQQENNRIIIKSFSDFTMKELSLLASLWFSKGGELAVFASEAMKRILVANNGDSAVHAGQLIKSIASGYSGKGGGNDKKAQAVFPHVKKMMQALDHIQKELAN